MPIEYQRICGLDEAGRGPLAGPVVAAAVVFPPDFKDERIKDSKVLSAKQRELLFDYICKMSLDFSIVAVGPRRIESMNILRASLFAMQCAAKRVNADLFLVDGNQRVPDLFPQQTVIGGDRIHVQISAASILAKVWRDRLMLILDKKYPGYGLGKHSGYPTVLHRKSLIELGPCRIHRKTFGGVKELLGSSLTTFIPLQETSFNA